MLNTFSKRRASQNEHELSSFAKFLKDNNVKRYLEIGARHGDTFHYIMSFLGKDTCGVAVDLPGGLWGRSDTGKSLIAAVKDLKSKDLDVSYLFGDSTEKQTIEHITELGPFDAIFIDGDHTLEGVTKDWNNYKDLAPLIAFHDIVGIGESESVNKNLVEVPVLWEELKKTHQYTEWIGENSKMGIGVVIL